jgi:hypothetical protein
MVAGYNPDGGLGAELHHLASLLQTPGADLLTSIPLSAPPEVTVFVAPAEPGTW